MGESLLRQFYLRRRFSQFLGLGDNFLDGADHVEGGFGQMIVFTLQDALESLLTERKSHDYIIMLEQRDRTRIVP